MGVSKVVYGNNTLVDLTNDTVSAEKLLEGETAHGADGEPVTGTLPDISSVVVTHPVSTAVGSTTKPVYVDTDGTAKEIGYTIEKSVPSNAAFTDTTALGSMTGTLPVDHGGTGQTTLAAARNAMGLGNTTGALPIANGGTGQTTAALARNALGLGNTTGAVPVANGGTGATTAANARSNLGAQATVAATGSSSRPVYVSSAGTFSAMSDWFNQSVKTTAHPEFFKLSLSASGAQVLVNGNNHLYLSAGTGSDKQVLLGTDAGVSIQNRAYTGTMKPIWASAFNVTSSKRVKENIVAMSEIEARKLLSVEVVSFDYKEEFGGQKAQQGVIAEDVIKNIPFVVNVSNGYDETKPVDFTNNVPPSVDYSKFVPYLIKMVQIQQEEIDDLKAHVEALES